MGDLSVSPWPRPATSGRVWVGPPRGIEKIRPVATIFFHTSPDFTLTEEGEEAGGGRQDRVTGQRHGPGGPSPDGEGHAGVAGPGPGAGGVAAQGGARDTRRGGPRHQVSVL